MDSSNQFHLRWNDFEHNISVAIRELREEKDFFDITLVCEDQKQIHAHKVILAACSPFFREVLHHNPHTHPLIFMRGVKFNDLKAILKFMYNGELFMTQSDLHSFLSVAEDLKIKGLTQNGEKESVRKTSSPSVGKSFFSGLPKSCSESDMEPPSKRPRKEHNNPVSIPDDSHDTHENVNSDSGESSVKVPVKSEPFDSTVAALNDDSLTDYDYDQITEVGDQNYNETPNQMSFGSQEGMNTAELDGLISDMMEKTVNPLTNLWRWRCIPCHKESPHKANIIRHIEANHVNHAGVSCPLCGRICKTRHSLRNHMGTYHNRNPELAYNRNAKAE